MADHDHWRPQTEQEREIISTLLLADFEGRDQVADQIRGARVSSDCGCGCGSLKFQIDRASTAPANVLSATPLDTQGLDAAGNLVGAFFFVRDGFVEYLEFWSLTGVDIGLPVASTLRLLESDGTGPGVSHLAPRAHTILDESGGKPD